MPPHETHTYARRAINIIGNQRLQHAVIRKLHSKGFRRVYGNTVALVGEALIQKDYGDVDVAVVAEWLLDKWEWVRACLFVGGRPFLKRLLVESNMPEACKGYVVSRILSQDRWRRDICLFTIDIPCVAAEQEGDASVADVLNEMRGSSAVEVLLMLGVYGVTIDSGVIRQLAEGGRCDVLGLMLDDDRQSFVDICSPQTLALIVLRLTFLMYAELLEGLRFVQERFPGTLESICRQAVA